MLIYVKYPADTEFKAFSLASDLAPGETLVSATATPSTPSGLTFAVTSVTSPNINISIGPGADGVSYGVVVSALTSLGRMITTQIAVSVNSQMASQYTTRNPDAFNTLLGELDAGDAAVGRSVWAFPPAFDATGGYVIWELLDQNGVTYSQGNAFEYVVTQNGVTTKIEARAIINIPQDVPTTLDGQSYQLRWTLQLGDNPYYSFENLRVTAQLTVPQGPEDLVEMAGDTATVQLVLDKPYEKVGFEIYQYNEMIVPFVEVVSKRRVADGWLYTGDIDTSAFPQVGASLDPYTISWVYYNPSLGSNSKNRQISRLFMVNASIHQATEDMRAMINKAATTIAHRADMIFTVPALLAFLRIGRDGFNGAHGMFTAFTMTNAQGPVRYFWLKYAEIHALRSQFLAEGEKVFNFSGQAISLDVDRTQYYSQLADNWQAVLDAEVKPVKQNLIKKGILGGDGNTSVIGLGLGATGAVGITITPASQFGKYAVRFLGGMR